MRGKVRVWFQYSEYTQRLCIGTNSNRNDKGLVDGVFEVVSDELATVGLPLHAHDFHVHTNRNGDTSFFVPLANRLGKIPQAFLSCEERKLPLAAEYRQTIY